MQSLPADTYEYAEWRKARVGIDYHVEVDRHFYSVPAALVKRDGKDVAYRVKCRAPSFHNISLLTDISRGCMIADMVAIIGSLDIVMGEVDR